MFIIKHDREKCIGCGGCVAVCPANWEMDKKSGKSKPKKTKLEDIGCNQQAMNSCPVGAITIEKK